MMGGTRNCFLSFAEKLSGKMTNIVRGAANGFEFLPLDRRGEESKPGRSVAVNLIAVHPAIKYAPFIRCAQDVARQTAIGAGTCGVDLALGKLRRGDLALDGLAPSREGVIEAECQTDQAPIQLASVGTKPGNNVSKVALSGDARLQSRLQAPVASRQVIEKKSSIRFREPVTVSGDPAKQRPVAPTHPPVGQAPLPPSRRCRGLEGGGSGLLTLLGIVALIFALRAAGR